MQMLVWSSLVLVVHPPTRRSAPTPERILGSCARLALATLLAFRPTLVLACMLLAWVLFEAAGGRLRIWGGLGPVGGGHGGQWCWWPWWWGYHHLNRNRGGGAATATQRHKFREEEREGGRERERPGVEASAEGHRSQGVCGVGGHNSVQPGGWGWVPGWGVGRGGVGAGAGG